MQLAEADAQIQAAMGSQGVTTSAVANQELGTSFSQPMNLRSCRGPQADWNQPNKVGANAIAVLAQLVIRTRRSAAR